CRKTPAKHHGRQHGAGSKPLWQEEYYGADFPAPARADISTCSGAAICKPSAAARARERSLRSPGKRAPSASTAFTNSPIRGRKFSPAKCAGSSAIRNCPSLGGPPLASMKLDASHAKHAPASAPQRISTISASAAPLAPPTGRRVPANALAGSVVGPPSASSAQPEGMASPLFLAATILLRATTESAISITRGARPGSGAAKARGLVPG